MVASWDNSIIQETPGERPVSARVQSFDKFEIGLRELVRLSRLPPGRLRTESVAYTIPTGKVSALDRRVEIDEQHHLRDETPDAYAAIREAYLMQRKAEIDGLHGKNGAANSPGP